jgi:hypothetical protein
VRGITSHDRVIDAGDRHRGLTIRRDGKAVRPIEVRSDPNGILRRG